MLTKGRSACGAGSDGIAHPSASQRRPRDQRVDAVSLDRQSAGSRRTCCRRARRSRRPSRRRAGRSSRLPSSETSSLDRLDQCGRSLGVRDLDLTGDLEGVGKLAANPQADVADRRRGVVDRNADVVLEGASSPSSGKSSSSAPASLARLRRSATGGPNAPRTSIAAAPSASPGAEPNRSLAPASGWPSKSGVT